MKNAYICLKCSRIAKIPASYGKSWSANTMVTSDFSPKVEIWPFRACAMKKICNWFLLVVESLMNSAMGEIPCSTERISCYFFTIVSVRWWDCGLLTCILLCSGHRFVSQHSGQSESFCAKSTCQTQTQMITWHYSVSSELLYVIMDVDRIIYSFFQLHWILCNIAHMWQCAVLNSRPTSLRPHGPGV